jgi:hypothetical protein
MARTLAFSSHFYVAECNEQGEPVKIVSQGYVLKTALEQAEVYSKAHSKPCGVVYFLNTRVEVKITLDPEEAVHFLEER